MDSAAELSFKMESAKQWQKNVEEEFKRVDELLIEIFDWAFFAKAGFLPLSLHQKQKTKRCF